MELMIEHLGKGLFLILILSLPAVLLAAGVGLVVGILQAVTQVQEQTISAAPKILSVFLLLIFGGGLMLNMMNDFLRESVQIAFEEIPRDGGRILPPQATDENRQRTDQFYAPGQSPSTTHRNQPFLNEPGDDGGGEKSNSQTGPTQITPKHKPSVSEELHLKKEAPR